MIADELCHCFGFRAFCSRPYEAHFSFDFPTASAPGCVFLGAASAARTRCRLSGTCNGGQPQAGLHSAQRQFEEEGSRDWFFRIWRNFAESECAVEFVRRFHRGKGVQDYSSVAD
jgi:hypothetical protein